METVILRHSGQRVALTIVGQPCSLRGVVGPIVGDGQVLHLVDGDVDKFIAIGYITSLVPIA